MKLLLKLFSALLFWSPALDAQNAVVTRGAGAPSGSCSFIQSYINTSSLNQYHCPDGTWHLLGPSGTAPSVTQGQPATGDANNDLVSSPAVRFADQYAGADAGAKIAAAISDLPSTGGTVDARGFEGAQAFSSTLTINKPITLLLGNATFTMTCSACTELIRISSEHVQIIGNGWANSVLLIGTAMGATIDAIRIAGASAEIQGLLLQDFIIAPQSGTPGRYGIHFDTTSFAIYQATVKRVKIDALSTYSIYSTNPALTDGLFWTNIEDSLIGGGIRLNRVGDTFRIINNRIQGSNIAINADCVSGAANLIVEGNNIYASGGSIRVADYCTSPRIVNNEIETPSGFVGSNGAVIDMDGIDPGPVAGPYIAGNTVLVIAAFSDDHAIRLSYTNDAIIEGNYFTRGGGSAKDISIVATTNYTRIGMNRYADQVLANILGDAGWQTQFYGMIAGATRFNQTVYLSNAKALGSLDEGGVARDMMLTAADGQVSVRGFHGRTWLDAGDGASYMYDSAPSATKSITAYAGNVGIGGSLVTLPGEALTLAAAGNIGWENGTTNVDTTLGRLSAGVVKSNGGIEITTFFRSGAADAADAGVIRLGNDELIAAEAAPTGTDGTLKYNASEEWEFNSSVKTTGLTSSGRVVVFTITSFADADLTPSVASSNLFKTGCTTPCTITALDDGITGQGVEIICTEANTTLSDAGTLKLEGGFTCTADDTISLTFDGANWFETARKVN